MKEKVKKLLVDNGLYRAPVDVVKLANNLGITILQQDLDYDGAILSNKEKFLIDGKKYNNVILININQIPTRKRFTIAHELAHWIETPEEERNQLYAHRDEGLTTFNYEPDINALASELLMPYDLVKNALRDIDYEYRLSPSAVYKIAEIFNVSYAAAKVRIEKFTRGR